MNRITRRTLLSGGAALGCAALSAPGFSLEVQKPLLFIHLFANGGWDVASFCDPKMNGNQKINTWAEADSIKTAGSLSYAPIANNAEFFTQHYDKMLVINGINAKTNVHSAGRLTGLTGHGKNGHPSICSLHAANHADHLPMPLLAGNSFETGGIISATKINSGLIRLLKKPAPSETDYLSPAQNQLIENAISTRLKIRQANSSAEFYRSSMLADESYFGSTINFYEGLSQDGLQGGQQNNTAVNDMKFTLAAFAAGASVACEYSISGFDTHDNHDTKFIAPITTLTQAASAAWAFAEQLKIADRLVVLLSSDFARTPFYNDAGGKDHWPFHSAVIMKKNAPWGNSVLGKTDEQLVGMTLNPSTLLPSPYGTLLEMEHIHQSLRSYLSISNKLSQAYPLTTSTLNNFLV